MWNRMKNLELYVHTPFCVRKCAYCDFLSFTADEKTQDKYVQALLNEIREFGARMQEYEVSTVYIGGGTPSWLSQEHMMAILETIGGSFHIRRDVEASIECNPGTVTKRKLLSYKQAGLNRLSIGLQSTDDRELKYLGRIHTYDQFLKTYELARNTGFDNINIDLMSGLPYQTVENYMKSLQRIIRLRPEHISAYSLIIEKGTPFYEQYKFDAVRQEAGMQPEILPCEDDVCQMTRLTRQMLTEAGYEWYEISNFAKPGYACRHNIGYWTGENYLGLGLGAASLLENVRYSNTRDIYSYIEGTHSMSECSYRDMCGQENPNVQTWFGTNLHESADVILKKSQMEEFMFLGLRMRSGISRAEFEKRFAMPIEAVYREPIEQLKEEALLSAREGRIALTDKGMDLANYAMAKFLF